MSAKYAISFEFEESLWGQGVTRVAGVDEAGRGPLAGPVVVAAVILPFRWAQSGLPMELVHLNDSKQLTAARRAAMFEFITSCGDVELGIQDVSADVIDQINILQATHRGMNEALAKLNPPPPHALVDGLTVKSLLFPQTAVVKGDARSYSIAAASILAKVTRDRMMQHLHEQYPGYGFADHKGYGTAKHLAAIARLGPCPAHRKTFAPIRFSGQDILR
jgi:ribonuclease HII